MSVKVRTQKHLFSRIAVLAMLVVGVLFSIAGAASADDVSNNLDASIDVVAEVMPLTVGGADGTTTLFINPINGDGKNGCNLTGSTILTVAVSSSDTSIATVTPTSVTFASCGDTRALTVHPVAAGATTVSVSQTANTTAGTFNLAPATFTVNVAAATPTNTAPHIAVAGVTGGGSYTKGSVPAATCNVTDAEDGNSSFAATLSAITGPNSADGIGSQTASCSYTDGGGLNAVDSVTYTIIDSSAPAVGYTLTPSSADGTNGWFRDSVTLTWNVSDPQSPGSLVETGCVDQSITTDQADTPYSCSATSAGGSTGPVIVSIKRDATAPAVLCGAADSLWHPADISVSCTASDALSLLLHSADSSFSLTTSVAPGTERSDASTNSYDVYDNAGNVFTAGPITGIRVDKKAPTYTCDETPTGWSATDISISCSAADGGSGLATPADGSFTLSTQVTANTETDNASTDTFGLADNVGNTGTATAITGLKVDKKPPTITQTGPTTSPNLNGWYNSDVVDQFAATDGGSGLAANCPLAWMRTTSGEGTAVTVSSGTCEDVVGNSASSIDGGPFKIDKTKPTISGSTSPAIPDGTNDWFKTAPTVTFTCSDALSLVFSCLVNGTSSDHATLGESAAGQDVEGTATDNAGNFETATVGGLKVDLSDPAVDSWSGAIYDGDSFYFGSVPPAPTCSGSDVISGIASCIVSGYSTAVGQHNLTATATDNAGRTQTAIRSYTVLAWTLRGFYQPTDMNGVFNVVKNGSTVPLKFEIFSGGTELTDTADVKSLTAAKINCDASAATDEVEATATGGTSLRYDASGGQFIYNWQTPKTAGICYRVTMTTQDLSTLVAYFKLK